jgi:hypothetical protein
MWVCTLKFGDVQCRVVMHRKYWSTDVHTKFSIVRCGLSGACIILVHGVCMNNNGTCGVHNTDRA